ncbi:putative acyl-CoA:6-aminopenicillanic-acid-acyltransferase [Aspergillus nomiae NRRL 13137]|uniref:Putative acyl-CoA:6-aminopenicillanic-acid-acyltransferase n=1 Tax=Aspergillus nomiae NRRL (strain ATCC 15546 / NRRL 13137 / CBS 260.88 / M93) TaxID=1509407 RepID=A0A0L1IVW1_ASPN3|nr:putative acyl-CoA:6-aminopenicillanic-acid-acyltransferase [Aspergillus nomiae NRRL 13137]KNG83530.1 putative acyl-CoA:6-aminopenicillanic-acid-acyltransferase [Aspergillus nomiae NRRL 13137]
MPYTGDIPARLVLKGTPREIGLAHGRQLQPQIKDQLEIYREMFEYTSKMDWPQVRALAEEFRLTAEQTIPDIHAEMQGIADGAGVDLLDIVALNCRSEISLGRFSDGCTALSWKMSEQARTLAQNWDWTTSVGKNMAMVRIEQPGKPVIHMVTEAGIVGKIGFNSAGVGVGLNAIKAPVCDSSKIPIHVALRLCLESDSVDAALERLTSLGGAASSQHILLADSSKSLGLELSPLGDVHIEEDQNGMIIHTNHFIANDRVRQPPWLPGSTVRLSRCQQLCDELIQEGVAGNKITPSLLRERIFSDRYNAPEGICCSEDLSLHPTQHCSTLFNIVMHLEPGQLGAEVVFGRPGYEEESTVVKLPW